NPWRPAVFWSTIAMMPANEGDDNDVPPATPALVRIGLPLLSSAELQFRLKFGLPVLKQNKMPSCRPAAARDTSGTSRWPSLGIPGMLGFCQLGFAYSVLTPPLPANSSKKLWPAQSVFACIGLQLSFHTISGMYPTADEKSDFELVAFQNVETTPPFTVSLNSVPPTAVAKGVEAKPLTAAPP